MTEKIKDILKPDSKIITDKLKSILDKEQDYAEFLYAIKEIVANELK